MFGLRLNEAKSMFFFDKSGKLMQAVDRATARVLSAAGAYIRGCARKSLRYKSGPSKPPHPPHSHTGLLRDFIFFGYDASDRSVVIGPTLLRQQPEYGNLSVPEILEYGGICTPMRRGKKYAVYAPRPYMGPAFEVGIERLPALWANSVK